MNKGVVLVMMNSGVVECVLWFDNEHYAQVHLISVAVDDKWITRSGKFENDLQAVLEYCEHTDHGFHIEELVIPESDEGTFVVLETFPDALSTNICVNEDGSNMIFGSRKVAQEYADNDCQDGRVVEL